MLMGLWEDGAEGTDVSAHPLFKPQTSKVHLSAVWISYQGAKAKPLLQLLLASDLFLVRCLDMFQSNWSFDC